MRDNYINSNKIKENKYKILRMSLILGSDDNRDETLNNFEESAREIDAMNDETYLSEIEEKIYDTLKLEEEEQKLAVLVDYIGGRVEQRISLLTDFANVTGYDLNNLPPIKYYDKLDDYKERLKYIREYLSNINQINQLTIEIEDSEKSLVVLYETKSASEERNQRNEEILLTKFNNLTNNIDFLKEITVDNIDTTLNNIISNVEESKKSLDIFIKSYTTLKGSGISYEEELEYKSYVDNAKEIYYSNKEQEYLLRLYQLLNTTETEYSYIIRKRETINELLNERMSLRYDLEIEESDILNPLYDILEKQYNEIEEQKNTIETIDCLNKLIETKKEERNDLELDNQKVEILSLLREFCIIDTYAEIEEPLPPIEEEPINEEEEPIEAEEEPIEEEIIPIEEETKEEPISFEPVETTAPITEEDVSINKANETNEKNDSIDEEKSEDNEVISIEDATNLDIELIQSKASKVMQRVGEMLGIKTEETKVVSITAEEESKVLEPTLPTEEENKILESVPTTEEETKIEEPTPKIEEEIPTEPIIPINPLPEANPLFTNQENPLFTAPENPLFNSTPDITTTSVDPEDENNFWFPSDMPDALNDLPDLEVATNNNFFGNNEMPELNFPDLKLDFSSSNTEEK